MHGSAGPTNSLWCYAKIASSQSTDLLESPSPHDGVSEPLAPKQIETVSDNVGFS